ncbi:MULTISPECIES: hypothetical protein [Microbacterium]|uniref:DUF4190 domain-containing protein n=1 Tax=Microbacterium schleiferi TaxID=69362 RepID=A0ABU7V744_9MICO|nr:hypothetical protein [Microbacterium sp. 67-17]MBD3750957.1 hypothetical protein [Micrococcales bacterium]OJW00653.1 MAG: hypothetical protein BGO47_02320 [Microbacterium sp. 67-17]
MAQDPRAPQPVGSAPAWGIAGIILGLGPLLLFAVAAAANLGGPLISVAVFGLPVLATTVFAVLVIRRLLRARQIGWGYTVAAVTIFAGVVGYLLWFFLALLAIQFGNGPA